MKQQTLANDIKLQGIGFYSSKKCDIVISPSAIDTGIVFSRNGCRIPISPQYLIYDRHHTTSLSNGKIRIRAIEHLLSALKGMRIDNALITLTEDEVPFIGCMSCKTFVESIVNVGIIKQNKDVNIIKIDKHIELINNKSWALLRPLKNDQLQIFASIDFPEPIGKQSLHLKLTPEKFIEEICWAKSFLSKPLSEKCSDEVTFLERKGEEIENLSKKIEDSIVLCFDNGIWMKRPYEVTEPIRHKILDLIGDLGLTGARINGEIIINRPGHRFNHIISHYLSENIGNQ